MEIIHIPFRGNKKPDEIKSAVCLKTCIDQKYVSFIGTYFLSDNTPIAKLNVPYTLTESQVKDITAYLSDDKEKIIKPYTPEKFDYFSIANSTNFTIYKCLAVFDEGIVVIPWNKENEHGFICFKGIQPGDFVKMPDFVKNNLCQSKTQ
jgi:hypothetical protein